MNRNLHFIYEKRSECETKQRKKKTRWQVPAGIMWSRIHISHVAFCQERSVDDSKTVSDNNLCFVHASTEFMNCH